MRLVTTQSGRFTYLYAIKGFRADYGRRYWTQYSDNNPPTIFNSKTKRQGFTGCINDCKQPGKLE